MGSQQKALAPQGGASESRGWEPGPEVSLDGSKPMRRLEWGRPVSEATGKGQHDFTSKIVIK